MTDQEKQQIFKLSQERAERDKIRNKGIDVLLGDSTVSLKALTWDDSNDFEDLIVEASRKLGDIMVSDLTKVRIDQVLEIVVGMLREDLVRVAEKATKGVVTINYIREVNATKDDVIKLVIEAFGINYGYLKNLTALMGASK